MNDVSEVFADDARRYRLDSRIATGGMGVVWRATDTVLGREVAVKVLKAEYADDPTFRSRFDTEARHAAALHHPGVAGVYDFGEAAAPDRSGTPQPYLVMELVEGQPLSRLLADGRPLDRDAVRDLLAQAGDALAAAHSAGIVHRDVKPANLIVTPEGRLKITDFGIARAADGVGITQTGTVMGTAQYLSPEQARGDRATPASDVYALGVVAFECLTGRRPFEAESQVATALAHIQQPVPELPADVPTDLAAVVHRALAKDPRERYADGAAFAAALRGQGGPISPPPVVPPAGPVTEATQVFPGTVSQPVPPPSPPAQEKPARKRAAWLVPLLVLLLVAAIAVAAIALTRGDDDTELPPSEDTTRPTRTKQSTPDEPTDTPTETPTETPTQTPTETPTEPTTTPPTTQTTPPTETTPTESSPPTSEPPTSATTGPPTKPEGEGT